VLTVKYKEGEKKSSSPRIRDRGGGARQQGRTQGRSAGHHLGWEKQPDARCWRNDVCWPRPDAGDVMSTFARVILAAACAALIIVPASAQQNNVRLRGTIEQADSAVLTVKSRQGETVRVQVADDVRVAGLVKASLADIKPVCMSARRRSGRERPLARRRGAHFRGIPARHRRGRPAHDLAPKSSMTNGTVSDIANGTVGGAVSMAAGPPSRSSTRTRKEDRRHAETVVVFYLPAARIAEGRRQDRHHCRDPAADDRC